MRVEKKTIVNGVETIEIIEVEDVQIVEISPEQQKQNILAELAELDKVISRVEEDLIAKTGLTIYPATQQVLSRKSELRAQLNTL